MLDLWCLTDNRMAVVLRQLHAVCCMCVCLVSIRFFFIKEAPYCFFFSEKLNKELDMLFFHDIYDLN